MEAKNMLLFVILLIGVGFVFITHYCDATDFDSINYGVHCDLTGTNITNVSCATPTNGTTASWYSVTNGNVKVGINITANVGTDMTVYYYNRTSGYYLVNTTYYTKGDSGPIDDYFIWTGLSNLTNYKWSVNISVNGSSEWWNMTGWYNFTTPEFISSVQFDSITFGCYVDLEEEAPPGQQFDSISFGVQAVIGENVTGGWTNYSTYWEFYKLDNRYDVYNTGDGVDINDIYKVYLQAQTTYDYLYDVYPSCNPDDTVDVNDYYMVYLNVD